MAESFHLHVVTPSGAALETEVSAFTIASKQGEITVLPGHCLLLSALEAGRMVVHPTEGTPSTYAVAGGYLEVGPDHANVICDRCKAAEKIDTAELPKQIADLEKKLADQPTDAPETAVDTEELKWLEACLAVAGK